MLTVALFPQIGLKFLETATTRRRFEPLPGRSRAAGGKSSLPLPVSTPWKWKVKPLW
ncbi:hypothetical protein KCP71_01555 [Salmonella enterica subsp. enterica]|nr:hypothetical protein KCP71_01555 [Salmonella enterica subsp. enterica]